MPVRRSSCDADRLEPQPLDERRAAHRDEHQVGLDGLALAEVNRELRAVVLDLRALLAEVECDPPLAELLRELLRRIRVLLRDQRVEHLDHGHLAAEAAHDRGELAADDPAAEHHEPTGNLGLREQARRVDAPRRVEPLDRRPHREGAGGDDRAPEGDVLPALDGDRVRVLERAGALDPFDPVRLQEHGDAARHLLADLRLPLVGNGEVELWGADLDTEAGEGLLGLLDRERGLHPRLGRDAADAQAGAAELGLALDAGHLAAELRGADRSGVPARPAAEHGYVEIHGIS